MASGLQKYKRKLFYALSPLWRRRVRKLYYLPLDLLSPHDPKIPKRGEIFTGAGDFVKDGNDFANYLIENCELNASTHILDIGCGIGRLAYSLTHKLGNEGLYNGFDVVADGINWCTQNITSKHPNFTFNHIDITNDLYNKGSLDASNFVFPYQPKHFNIATAISVFTHMQTSEVANYFREAAKVLEDGGYLMASFFLMTAERLKHDNPSFSFKYKKQNAWYMDDKVKSANVAYDKKFLFELSSKCNLEIVKIDFGNWHEVIPNSDQSETLFFQDFVVFRKCKSKKLQ